MKRREDVSRGLSNFHKFSRGRKLVGLVPIRDALSDDGITESDEEENVQYRSSSEAPSLDSSLERLDLLNENSRDSPDFIENSDNEAPLTPIIRKVFPTTNQVVYENIPSLSSIPSLPSPACQNSLFATAAASPGVPSTAPASPAIQNVSTTPITRAKRKVIAKVTLQRKKRKKIVPIQYTWKRQVFKHKAMIEEADEFVFRINEDSPSDYFKKYFSDDILVDIVLNTNLYSVQNTGKSINITESELKDFIAILLMMGIVKMPSYLDYWSPDYRFPNISETMGLERFQQIRRYLHFVDNANCDSDRFYKVRPLVEKVRLNCLATEEETRYSVDEMTVPYKGNKAGNRKQYNPMKPDKWGFKNFVRAGMSGIVYDFIIYAGEDTFRYVNFTEEEEKLTLGAKVVVALCKTIQTPASVVYFDNYFSTLDLVRHLRENYGLFSLGTIRQNRLRGCDKLLMSDKEMKKKGRGTFCQMVDNKNKLAIVKWFDNKVVTLVSSYQDAYPVEKIKRYSREERKKVDVSCPQLVKQYNAHMGGVDLCDMMVALYRTKYKSRRWYTAIFAQMLDICVNNAWLLYRRNCTRRAKKNIALKKFRNELAQELILGSRNGPFPQDDPEKKTKARSKPRPTLAVRYDSVGHWQDFTTYGRCKHCKINKTEVFCTKCNQRLCFVRKRNCFAQFHKQISE